jgi:hypothetical protein
MRLRFNRSVYTANARYFSATVAHYSPQEGIRSVSSFATALQELKNNSGKFPTIGTKKAERKRAYDYASVEAIFARHVLRIILRECSYLPDSFAADYIRNHAFLRFRTNEYKAWKNRNQFESQDKSRRKEARGVISTLQRANEGERRCMLKVLHTAYGRIGKRRHELIKPLLYVEGQDEILSEGSKDVGDASGAARPKEKAAAKTKLAPTTPLDLTPQLRALLTSQIQAKPPSLARTTLKSAEPSISTLNSWLQPMPQNRIRNARKKHYAMLLDRVQAPLPAEEWERLRDLAMGRLPALGQVERRKLARSSSRTSSAVGREQHALELITRYGRVPKEVLLDDAPPLHARSRNFERWMQRLYAEVFSQCPLMDWNSTTGEWEVTWGFQALKLQSSRHGGHPKFR